MNIDIILEGKIREPYFKAGTDEFVKRLSGYINLKVIEVNEIDSCLKNFKPSDFIVTLEIEGQMLSSMEFAEKLKEIENDGYYNKIVFLIGGANGLSKSARETSNFKFSMSKLTFLHQEACMILSEQIYRAVKILKNEPYHK